MRRLLLSVCLILCGGAPAAAQGVALEPGTRVRVRHDAGERLTGRLVAVRDDTLWVSSARDGGRDDVRLGVPVSRVRAVHRSAGRHRPVLRNAGIGAALGVAAGAVATVATLDEEFGFVFASPYEFGAFVGVAVGVPTTAIGALSGLIPVERWERVPLATPPPASGGLSVRPKVGTMRVPVRGAPPARALTLGVTLRPR